MNRSLFAAPAVAALLLTGLTGIAAAQTDEQRSCAVVEAELAEAETAAQLPVTIGGGTFTTLPALQDFRDRLADTPAAQDSVAKAQAVLDAAARVSVLQQEQTTCTDTTEEPPAAEEPTADVPDPAETQSPADRPEVPLYADCAEARSFGAAPINEGNPGYRAGLDSDGDGVACEIDDPDTAGNTATGDDDTLGGTDDSNSGIVDSIPSGAVATGYVA